MINTYTYDGETWVDVDSGTPEEIHGLMDTYGIHPFVAKELTSTTRKPRIEFHDNYIYCILHFPAFKHTHATDANQEVDFIIGKKVLITARYDTIDPLHKFAKTLEVKEILHRREHSHHTLFIGLLRELYFGLNEELDSIEDMTDDITLRIYNGHERAMVEKISLVTRTLLDFKKTSDLHRDVLESLYHYGKKMFGDDFGSDMESILLDYQKINNIIQSNLAELSELRTTNDSLLQSKQNDIFKQLTIISFIILPITAVAQLFGMSIHQFPLADNPNAFWIILTAMVACGAIAFVYVKHKRWL